MNFKKRNFWLTFVLCFSLVFNPLIVQVALYAQDTSNVEEVEEEIDAGEAMNTSEDKADEASEEVDKTHDKLKGTKKAKTKWYMSGSTKRKIKKANRSLGDATEDVGKAKEDAREAADSVQAIGDTIDGDDNALDKLAKVKSGVQTALIKTGQLLQSIGQMLKTVGKALQAIGQVLQAIPWTSAIGAALVNVGKTLHSVGSMLDAVGKVIEKIGQTAEDADQNFGDMVGQIFQAGKDGWKQGQEEAEQYQNELDQETQDADTSQNMGEATQEIQMDTGAEAETVEDLDQQDVTDF
ncbi:MAG: hypothetical protein ACQETH_11705 [Candidatus Rifleibacteriota bacterium]